MKFLFSALLLLVLVSCGSTQKAVKSVKSNKTETTKSSNYRGKNSAKVNEILKDAEKYLGVPYQYGGNTTSGLDCSGLVCKVFDENGTKLPRRSSEQALEGKKIRDNEIQPGDLVFFATSGGDRVSHVGIVHSINEGEIKFIHSSTSKGVIISSLNNNYWNKAFLFAKRVL